MDTTTNRSGISIRAVWEDLTSLTKARLSFLVVITAVFGYLLATKGTGNFSLSGLFHTTFGSFLAALGAAVFNQIMEVDADSKMSRTADRPLPADRIPRSGAFILGWILSAFGIVHLSMMANFTAGAFAALTLFVYLFIYTPMKRTSTFNTIVGAVAGAFPPLIGWSAGGGSIWGAGAAFLFLLLFFWQLPHFAAINWMYREEYVRGGFVMWSNDDEKGKKTATLALIFSLCLVGVGLFGLLGPGVNLACSIGIMAAGGYLSFLSYRFLKSSLRADARRLFFFTLMYLPFVLTLGYLGWSPVEHGS